MMKPKDNEIAWQMPVMDDTAMLAIGDISIQPLAFSF